MTSTVSTKYQVVIPLDIRERLEIKPGTRLQFTVDGEELRLCKEPELDEIRGMLKGMKLDDSQIRDESDRNLP